MPNTTQNEQNSPEIRFISEITVEYLQHMGSDDAISGAARVMKPDAFRDYQQATGDEHGKDVAGIINYMMKHRHGTPFEHSAISIYVHAPIFVWREWHRHRIGFSYNEESARYNVLEPVFYIPPPDRPMMKVENWKPARPKFMTIEDYYKEINKNVVASIIPIDEMIQTNTRGTYTGVVESLKECYKLSYEKYQDLLNTKIDPGLARDCLPVGIYSSCWVTLNVRSMMNFLSLRTFNADAMFLSYPLYEIDIAAQKVEEIFKQYWPITHRAFCDNKRVAP